MSLECPWHPARDASPCWTRLVRGRTIPAGGSSPSLTPGAEGVLLLRLSPERPERRDRKCSVHRWSRRRCGRRCSTLRRMASSRPAATASSRVEYGPSRLPSPSMRSRHLPSSWNVCTSPLWIDPLLRTVMALSADAVPDRGHITRLSAAQALSGAGGDHPHWGPSHSAMAKPG